MRRRTIDQPIRGSHRLCRWTAQGTVADSRPRAEPVACISRRQLRGGAEDRALRARGARLRVAAGQFGHRGDLKRTAARASPASAIAKSSSRARSAREASQVDRHDRGPRLSQVGKWARAAAKPACPAARPGQLGMGGELPDAKGQCPRWAARCYAVKNDGMHAHRSQSAAANGRRPVRRRRRRCRRRPPTPAGVRAGDSLPATHLAGS